MKRKSLVLTLVSATMAAVTILGVACKKEIGQSEKITAGDLGKVAINCPTCQIPAHTLIGVLGTGGHNVVDSIRLTANSGDWLLDGIVYVDSADVLVIDPGVTIRGKLGTAGSPGTPGGGLVVARGGKIFAEGTATNRILFTSIDSVAPVSGQWAGVVIIGNAPSNHPARAQVEGIPGVPPVNATYGGTVGTVPGDHSGSFRYVRIEYAGYELSANNEINGLTLAGVGSATDIDHVCVFKSKDDGIEFFGGTVNVDSVIVVDALDDLYDADNGYSGSVSYALGLADTLRSDVSQSNGLEVDNNSGGTTATPKTAPKFNFVSIFGLRRIDSAQSVKGGPTGAGKHGRAAHFRRNTEFDVNNSIFLGFNYGISLDSTLGSTPALYRASYTTWLNNTTVHAYLVSTNTNSTYITEGAGSDPASALGTGFALTKPQDFKNLALTAGLGNTSFTNATNAGSSIGLTNFFNRSSYNNFIAPTGTPGAGKGAFPGGTNWVTGNWARIQ